MSFLHLFEHHFHTPTPLAKPKDPPGKAAPPKADAFLLEMSRADVKTVLEKLKSTPEGLTPEEAQNRLREQGPNEVVHDKPDP